jgi:hypothetical protein
MLLLKACPKCGGDLYREYYPIERCVEWSCVQCCWTDYGGQIARLLEKVKHG